MTHPAPARTTARRTREPASTFPLVASDHNGAAGEADNAVPRIGITIYGCGQEEAALFREMAPRFGATPTITDAAVSEANVDLALGSRCISIGHKSQMSAPVLVALRQAGVRYISTRSVGYNHIDMKCAESAGICVENVAYSPDSVADYTLMLMLMAVRNAEIHHQPGPNS